MKPRKALPRLKARLCRTRSHHAPRAASRDVPSVSVHRAIARRQQFEHDDPRTSSVSFFTPSRGAGAPDCTERTPHRPLPGPSTPQAPVRPPGERRRSARLRDQVLDTPGVHKSKNKPRRARWSSYTDSDGDHHSSEEY